MNEVLALSGVSVDVITIRTTRLVVISRGWSYSRREYEDLEDMYVHITGSMVYDVTGSVDTAGMSEHEESPGEE